MSSGAGTASTSVGSSGLPSPNSDSFDDCSNRLTMYLHQLAGCYEMDVDVIMKDHCYARPWNWKPENVYVKPVKKLFFSKNSIADKNTGQDEEIDIEGDIEESQPPPFDLSRSKHVMEEFQRLANFARPDENDDWEEKIDKTLWSPLQNRIFAKVIKILTSERLARLAKANNLLEPIHRRTTVDVAARRFRETLASTGWDWKVVQWLHSLLFDNLSQEYLAIYLDILQTMRLKIPQLIDKMIAVQPNINAKGGAITWETLGSMLKRSWDPVASSLSGSRLKKLPGNPILIIAPSGIGSNISSRQHKWISQLGTLGMVITVHTHLGVAATRMTMMVCIDQLIQATRTKIQDVRSDYPGRPIILVGFNTGAALACQIAQMEHVTAVICLGFPFNTVEGKRGTPDDTLMDIRCPVMFIIGQHAALVRTDDLEDLREKMLVETSLVVVGSADDHLRISTAKKISEGITQSMVDRCILDEIGDFVGSILLQPHPLPLRPTSMSSFENKSTKKEVRKRKNSTSSSVESEPNSPTMKKSRPTTPVSLVTVGSNTTPGVKTGTFSTQPTLVTVSGSHSNTVKRKPRVVNNPKTQFVEHLITSRNSGQSINPGGGGITLNIGSLASLAPIGPIRLTPATIDQIPTTKSSNPKSPSSSTRIPKIVSTGMSFQNMSKMKTVMSANKGFSKVMPPSYKQNTDKSGDTKLLNVLPSGSQIRISASTSGVIHNKSVGTSGGSLSTLLQNGKNSITLGNSSALARVTSTSSILLASNSSSTNSVTASTSTAPKELEDIGNGSSQNAMLNSTHSLDISTVTQLPLHVTASSNKDNSLATSGGVIMLTENSHNVRSSTSSVIVPFSAPGNILPLSNRLKAPHKPMKTMPKITVNTNNLQRLQRAKPQNTLKKNYVNEVDDDLGNILDIPIIFAKDDDNLSSIEKMTPFSQVPLTLDNQDKTTSKLNNATKVVLISNKQDKLPQTTSKILSSPGHATILCPSTSTQNVNHVILQTRPQNPTISARGRAGIPIQTRTSQPAIKYTKIILAKRNTPQSVQQSDKSEHVILTRTTQKLSVPQILNLEKNEHQYAQTTPKLLTQYQSNLPDDILEIEDAIKTNIIERKCVNIPEIDLTSPTKVDDISNALDEAELTNEKQDHLQCSTFNDSTDLQNID